jgi:predicted Zn finger-like uncharacterized protein
MKDEAAALCVALLIRKAFPGTMLITCGSCKCQYDIDGASFGPNGRMVRCTGCGHMWRARGGTAIAILPPLPVVQDAEWDDAGLSWCWPAAPEAPTLISPPPQQPRHRAAAAVLVACLGVLGGMVAARAHVVPAVPASARLFEAIGLPVNVRGLAFRDIKTVETTENGGAVLIVSGTIDNLMDKTVAVPRLRLAVREGKGHEVYVWTAEPHRAELAAGDSQTFWAKLAAPPADGRDVAVRFTSTEEPLMTASLRKVP